MPHLRKVAVHGLGVQPRDVDAIEIGLHPEAGLGQHLIKEHLVGEGSHVHASDLLCNEANGNSLMNTGSSEGKGGELKDLACTPLEIISSVKAATCTRATCSAETGSMMI